MKFFKYVYTQIGLLNSDLISEDKLDSLNGFLGRQFVLRGGTGLEEVGFNIANIKGIMRENKPSYHGFKAKNITVMDIKFHFVRLKKFTSTISIPVSYHLYANY